MNINNELKALGEWLENNKDLSFFSDVKLKKMCFTFVGSNIYRYALILTTLGKYIGNNNIHCLDFGSYPGQLQELMLQEFKVRFDMSGLDFSNAFKEYFSKFKILDFDFEKSVDKGEY